MVAIDEANNVCTCRYEDGDVGEDLRTDEVFHAPGRSAEGGKGALRGNDKVPEGALPVMFLGADEEEVGGEVNEGGGVSGERVVVIDSGSGFLQAGWAGNDSPGVVFPSIVGRAKDGSITPGDEALAPRVDDRLKLHGKDLAPHLIQQARHARGASSSVLRAPHRGAAQPQKPPRAHDANHARHRFPGPVHSRAVVSTEPRERERRLLFWSGARTHF